MIKTRQPEHTDPVLSDQGGRMTASDPLHSTAPASEEKIRRKAYELYEQRGKQNGRELEDWLQAESQVDHSHLENM